MLHVHLLMTIRIGRLKTCSPHFTGRLLMHRETEQHVVYSYEVGQQLRNRDLSVGAHMGCEREKQGS